MFFWISGNAGAHIREPCDNAAFVINSNYLQLLNPEKCDINETKDVYTVCIRDLDKVGFRHKPILGIEKYISQFNDWLSVTQK